MTVEEALKDIGSRLARRSDVNWTWSKYRVVSRRSIGWTMEIFLHVVGEVGYYYHYGAGNELYFDKNIDFPVDVGPLLELYDLVIAKCNGIDRQKELSVRLRGQDRDKFLSIELAR